MNLLRKCPTAALVALACSAATPALAGDFVDTRLVFLAGDDDFAHDAGTTIPVSPRADIGSRAGYDQFYDALNGSETGRESRTELVLYKKLDGYFPKLTTEAAVALELNHSRVMTGDPRSLQDDGSYIRITQGDLSLGNLEVLLMPFRSDRLRLGYLWNVTWGGDGTFPGSAPVPGARLRLFGDLYEAYVGMKTTRLPFNTAESDPRKGQLESYWGFFGGGRFGREDDGFRVDLGLGYFDKGTNPNGSVRGEDVPSYGGSVRLAYSDGMPFTASNDMRLYTADPTVPFTEWAASETTQAWRVAAEGTLLQQKLEDPDTVGGTTWESGHAAALQGGAQLGFLRLGGVAIYRDLGFIHFNGPGTVRRYQAMPSSYEPQAETTLMLSAQRRFADYHLTPGVEFGAQSPAAVSNLVPNAGIHAPSVDTGRRTVVYRRADMFDDTGLTYPSILPDQSKTEVVLGGRLSLQMELGKGFGVTAAMTVLSDPNRAELIQDKAGVNTLRKFTDALTLGASVMARAEF